jgi:hypothetical protein
MREEFVWVGSLEEDRRKSDRIIYGRGDLDDYGGKGSIG